MGWKTSPPEGIKGFELDVVLVESWSHDLPFNADTIRLHCVPVINLFPLEADPLHLSPLENEYLLRPMRIGMGILKSILLIESSPHATPAIRRMSRFPVFAIGAACCVTMPPNAITTRG